MLIGQNYSVADDRAHIRWLLSVFEDERYIRIDGKPLFLVYRIGNLPDPNRRLSIWREEAHSAGLGELFLCKVDCFADDRTPPAYLGFDAAVEFQPDTAKLLTLREKVYWRLAKRIHWQRGLLAISYFDRAKRGLWLRQPHPTRVSPVQRPLGTTAHADSRVRFFCTEARLSCMRHWLHAVVERYTPPAPDRNLIFINAWNEWAEGNHLEPCLRWGRGLLWKRHNAD